MERGAVSAEEGAGGAAGRRPAAGAARAAPARARARLLDGILERKGVDDDAEVGGGDDVHVLVPSVRDRVARLGRGHLLLEAAEALPQRSAEHVARHALELAHERVLAGGVERRARGEVDVEREREPLLRRRREHPAVQVGEVRVAHRRLHLVERRHLDRDLHQRALVGVDRHVVLDVVEVGGADVDRLQRGARG